MYFIVKSSPMHSYSKIIRREFSSKMFSSRKDFPTKMIVGGGEQMSGNNLLA